MPSKGTSRRPGRTSAAPGTPPSVDLPRPPGEAGGQGIPLGRGELRLALCPRLVGRRQHLQQDVFEISGPGLLVLLFHKRQLAQVVDVAERMKLRRVPGRGDRPTPIIQPELVSQVAHLGLPRTAQTRG